MNALERRCRRLLRAYPAGYRAERGEEILGTLLECAPPGQAWPRLREVVSLVVGGLRVRAAQNRRLSTPADLRLALILGLAIIVAFTEADQATQAASFPLGRLDHSARFSGIPGHTIVAASLALTAIMLIWFAPRYVAVPALGLAAAVSLHPLSAGINAAVTLALLALLAVLAGLSPLRPPRSWLWWLAVLPAWAVLRVLGDVHPLLGRIALAAPVPIIFLVAALLWAVVDARIALACAVVVALYGALVPPVGAVLVPIAVLAAPALLRIRRQAVL
jgi:hypothetical protein